MITERTNLSGFPGSIAEMEAEEEHTIPFVKIEGTMIECDENGNPKGSRELSFSDKVHEFFAKKSNQRKIAFACCGIVVLAMILQLMGYGFVYIKGNSMAPGLTPGAIYLTNRVSRNEVQRNHIYIVKVPGHGTVVKRVVGLGGDVIESKWGKIFVNGEYLTDSHTSDNFYCEVPKNKVFLLGDNLKVSIDSRYYENPYISIGRVKAEVCK